MKKTIKLGLLLLMIIFVLTGCNTQTVLKLNNDDSLEVAVTTIISEEQYKNLLGQYFTLLGQDIGTISEEEIKQSFTDEMDGVKSGYEMDGYTVGVSYNEETKTQEIKATKTYKNTEEILGEVNQLLGITDIFITDREDGKREINIKIDMSSGSEGLEDILKEVKYTFKLELPYSVEESNATEISKNRKTLTWDLELTKENELTILTNKVIKNSDGTYRGPLNTMVMIIGIAVTVIAVIGIVIVIVSKKENHDTKEIKKGDDKTEENN